MELLTKDSSINEVDQAEVLQQVILDGSARYQHPPLGTHGIQGLVRLVVRVLQSMALQHTAINVTPQRSFTVLTFNG